MSFSQPLDLYDLLVNTLSGNIEVFLFIFIIAMAILGAKLKMSNTIFLAMIGLFVVFIANYFAAGYLIVLLITGFIVFEGISKVMK